MEVFDMISEPLGDYETGQESLQGDPQEREVECPNCKSSVPRSIYCLSCGFPMYSMMKGDDTDIQKIDERPGDDASRAHGDTGSYSLTPVASMTEIEGEGEREHSAEQGQGPSDPLLRLRRFEPKLMEESDSDYDEGVEIMVDDEQSWPRDEPADGADALKYPPVGDGATDQGTDESNHALIKNLINSANLRLWSISQLLEGSMSEENFMRLFKGYDARWRLCIEQRRERLEQTRDMRALQEGLERASVNLGELDLRKSIDDLYEGEYEAKAPAFQWEISHFEGEVEKRKERIRLLEDLRSVVSKEELSEIVSDARMYLERLESQQSTWEYSRETYEGVKASLEETFQYLTSDI